MNKNPTPKEIEVLNLIRRGANNKQIAKKLNISESTVKLHVSHLFKKYAAKSRLQLLIFSTPKREWVGLTDEDKSLLVQKYKHIETGTEHDENLIAEIEAKLKEKNT
jgi:DNA-binding MarR family transcriptional regulator